MPLGPTWSRILQRYGGPILYLVGLFGWVVVVPLFGDATAAWAAAHSIAAGPLYDWFLLAHAVGLVATGYLIDRWPRTALSLARLVPVVDAILSLLMLAAAPAVLPLLFAAMGIVTALGMTAWGRWYATSVETVWLGQTFALAAAGIAVFHFAFGYLVAYVPVDTLLLWALLPLGLALLGASAVGTESVPVPRQRVALPARGRLRAAARFGLFICCFSVVAGLSDRFFVTVPISPYVHDFLRMAPYIVGVLVSGVLADRRGLLSAMVAGAGLLATAFLIGAWSENMLPAIVGTVFNGLAFGLLEPAPWLLLAAMARPRSAGRWFGWGLNLNVVPIFIGAAVAMPLSHVGPTQLGLMATVFTLLAVLILYGARDPLATLHQGPAGEREEVSAVESLERRFGAVLTERELEVGRLAVGGVSNREIAEKLYLSENTVKTHLKSVFRKTGCANRNELFRSLVGDAATLDARGLHKGR